MTIEQQALALLNEVHADRLLPARHFFDRKSYLPDEALCRAIERHEAFRQEVSEAVKGLIIKTDECCTSLWQGVTRDHLSHFVIASTDPLVEAATQILLNDGIERTTRQAEAIRAGNAGQDKIALIVEGIKHGMAMKGDQS